MSKGDDTRQAVLTHAFTRAAALGLEGLTIGSLADELGMSKSGLFAHFNSKEALQIAVIEHAADRFVERVIKPTLKAPRGERRLRALFENWLVWGDDAAMKGEAGCFMVSVAAEFDDRPGPVRTRVARMQRDFLDLIANIARTAIEEGAFDDATCPDDFAFRFYGIMLSWNLYGRLLEDPHTRARTTRAFEALLATCRRPAARRRTR